MAADAPAPPAATSVAVDATPAGSDRVLPTESRIDGTHSNAYTVWRQRGSPQHPDAAQHAQLRAAGQLQLLTSPTWIDVRNGTLELPTDMPRQSVALIQLSW